MEGWNILGILNFSDYQNQAVLLEFQIYFKTQNNSNIYEIHYIIYEKTVYEYLSDELFQKNSKKFHDIIPHSTKRCSIINIVNEEPESLNIFVVLKILTPQQEFKKQYQKQQFQADFQRYEVFQILLIDKKYEGTFKELELYQLEQFQEQPYMFDPILNERIFLRMGVLQCSFQFLSCFIYISTIDIKKFVLHEKYLCENKNRFNASLLQFVWANLCSTRKIEYQIDLKKKKGNDLQYLN